MISRATRDSGFDRPCKTYYLALGTLLLLSAAVHSANGEPVRLDVDCDIEVRGDRVHVIVNELIEGGLAHRLGIQPNEIIELIDAQPIASEVDLHARLAIGPPLALYVRNPLTGKLRVLKVEPKLWPPGNNLPKPWKAGRPILGREQELVGTWAEYRTATGRPTGLLVTIDDDTNFYQESQGQLVAEGTAKIFKGRLTLTYSNGNRESARYTLGRDRVDFWAANGIPEAVYWQAVAAGPAVDDLEPRLISRSVVASQPLEPATVEFQNSHRHELWVVIRNSSGKAASTRLKIPPGQSETIQLDRYSGETVVETWEIPLRNGEVVLEQRKAEVPGNPLYAVSVYELFVQSVALDATKKDHGRIEDINYSPKSVGAFSLPADASLNDGTIKAYQVAARQKNPGAVDRIDPSDWRSDESLSNDPIEEILRKGGR